MSVFKVYLVFDIKYKTYKRHLAINREIIELQKRVTKLHGVKYGAKDKEHKKTCRKNRKEKREKWHNNCHKIITVPNYCFPSLFETGISTSYKEQILPF